MLATPPTHATAWTAAWTLAKDATDASYFYRAAVNFYPGAAEVAPAQFYIAWQAHEGKNFSESSRLLTEHLANYADRNTDFRGKAAYWAARDSERIGKLAEARAIYQGLQARYDANWYGYLAKQRLDTMNRNGNVPRTEFPADSLIGRAVANLKTVTVAEETAGPSEDERIAKACRAYGCGTFETCRRTLKMSAFRGRPEMIDARSKRRF